MKESGTILDRIVAAKRIRLAAAMETRPLRDLAGDAHRLLGGREQFRLRKALSDGSKINIIAEFKRASPSKGTISETADPAETCKIYADGGAAAISVLTEEDNFNGSLDDLRSVRMAVDVPILRKDFVFDEYQVYEAAEAGADAILLIAAMLDDRQIVKLKASAEKLGLDSLVEVHDADELDRVAQLDAGLIGVNNRSLKTFEVNLDVSRELIGRAPDGAIMVAESGLTSGDELSELWKLGYSGFLIGESLMRSGGNFRSFL